MSRPSKPVVLCLLIATLAACLVRAAPVTELKVMSFNLWVNGGLSLTQCVAAIRASGADLVGLQECNAATAQTIATNLGFHMVPADDCPILSRYPIISSQLINYSRGVTVQLSPGSAHTFSTLISRRILMDRTI